MDNYEFFGLVCIGAVVMVAVGIWVYGLYKYGGSSTKNDDWLDEYP